MSQRKLILKNVSVGYPGVPVIENLDLEIPDSLDGDLLGLGPNGAGKSTLLLAIGGQFQPENGSIIYGEDDIYTANIAYKHKTGYVHESPFLYPRLTVV